MLFTFSTHNLCIVFASWRITSTLSLLISLLGIILLTAGYELVRDASRRYEARSAEYVNKLPRTLSISPWPFPSSIAKKLFPGKQRRGPRLMTLRISGWYPQPRTQLTTLHGRRANDTGGRDEGEDREGGIVCRAGVL